MQGICECCGSDGVDLHGVKTGKFLADRSDELDHLCDFCYGTSLSVYFRNPRNSGLSDDTITLMKSQAQMFNILFKKLRKP